jgi:hypothetical protein
MPNRGVSQLTNIAFVPKGIVHKETGIILLVQNVRNPCGNNVGLGRKKTVFRLRIPSNKIKYFNPSNKYYLNLRLSIADCKGNTIFRTYSIDLNRIGKDGEIKNDKELQFEGSSIISFDGFVKEVKSQPICESRLPEFIVSSVDNSVNPGEIVELSAGDDGYICQNAQWEWLVDDCENGNRIQFDRNSKIIVTPRKTSTYFLRISQASNKSSCISHTIYVKDPQEFIEEAPKPVRLPILVAGLPLDDICPNTNIRLLVSGGLEGNNNRWIWRKYSCSGDIIGRGNVLDLKSDQSLIVYVSDENDTESECKESEIRIKKLEPPIDLLINNGEPYLSICEGESITLRASNLPNNSTFQLRWSDDQNKTLSQNKSLLTVSPGDNMRYYLKGEGECNTNTKTSVIEVKVIKKSKSPTSVIQNKIRGKKYRFSPNGGSLEAGANWKWYKGIACENGEYLGEGAEVITKIRKLNSLSVRAEGGSCGSSLCYTHPIVRDKKKTGFGFFNVGVFDERFDNLSFSIGSKRVYLRYKSSIKQFDIPYDITYNVSGGYSIPNFPNQSNSIYAFNGQKASIRTGYTGGAMIGGGKVRLYLGGGFGEVNTLWGVDVIQNNTTISKTQAWGSVKNKNYKGIEAEGGLFIRLGILNLMGGINVINDQSNGNYIEGTGGIGFTW